MLTQLELTIYNSDIDLTNLPWTSRLDEDENILEIPITRKICELETSHIHNIFTYTHDKGGLNPLYSKAFKQELNKRRCLDEENRLATRRCEMPQPVNAME